MTNSPLISILMATYNRCSQLPRAIKSIQKQIYENWELCLVNDGGESVEAIVKAANDSRIRLTSYTPNKGKGYAINMAFSICKGKYIAYLDDDDIWYNNHLEVLVKTAESIQSPAFVYSNAAQVSIEKQKNGKHKIIGTEVLGNFPTDIEGLLEYNSIAGIIVLHTASLFTKVGGFDENLRVLLDFDMWRRLACYAKPHHIDKITAELYANAVNTDGHITNLFAKDSFGYRLQYLKVIFKKLHFRERIDIDGVSLEKKRKILMRKNIFRYAVIACHKAQDANDFHKAKAYIKHATKNICEDKDSQMFFAHALLRQEEVSRAVDLFKVCLVPDTSLVIMLILALHGAMALKDEWSFVIFKALQIRQNTMTEQEKGIFKSIPLKMKKAFGKRYYEVCSTK